MVGVTLAAIEDNTLWLAQAGSQTRCYRVRGRRPAQLLSRDNRIPLGRQASLPALEVMAHKLKTGDKLVLCSDGLYAGELVTPADMAKIARYADQKGAARHLSARAMGRNVRDNVTVLVSAYGSRRRLRLRPLLFDAFGVLAAVVIVTILAFVLIHSWQNAQRPPDLGRAVLAQGDMVGVEQFGVIGPGTQLETADSPVQINLQKRESSETSPTATAGFPFGPAASATATTDASYQTLKDVDIYFGSYTHANLAIIHMEGFIDRQVGMEEPVDLTEITLEQGQALILSKNPRTYYVSLGPADDSGSPRVVLEGADAALGADRQGDQATAYCLQGSCSIRLARQSVPFPPGSKISLRVGSTPLTSISPEALEVADVQLWYSLCSTWSGSFLEPPMCEDLLP
ncbi:MAG: PP2C family protein-serine/threonine phosphatase, partial [Bacteroidota bacterium]